MNEDIIRTLERRMQKMIEYLDLRRELHDWHGVMDASADIREIEAQIRLLKELR